MKFRAARATEPFSIWPGAPHHHWGVDRSDQTNSSSHRFGNAEHALPRLAVKWIFGIWMSKGIWMPLHVTTAHFLTTAVLLRGSASVKDKML